MYLIVSLRTALRAFAALVFAAVLSWPAGPAHAADPIKVGFTMALTGGVAPNGKQLLLALEIWRDDVNAKGGLLGRPVELVYYDDQSNPANVPGLYTKLISVDKVDLLIGPYATNMIAPAMPVLMQHNKLTISMLGVNVNQQFNYPKYFSMVPGGAEGSLAFSRGWFEIAMAQNPKPKTVAIVAADAEFGRTSCDGARENAKAAGLKIVYDRTYPPATTDLTPVVRAVQAANPDLLAICSYPLDSVGMIRAINEVGFRPKMVGGAMVGLQATAIKMQLGAQLNGIVNFDLWLPTKTMQFPGVLELVQKYQARAQGEGIDPLGYYIPPWSYAYLQVLQRAIEATNSVDDGKLADYLHKNPVKTVVGEIRFGSDGEWVASRMLQTQFQNIQGNDLSQFKDMSKLVILTPQEFKSGSLIYPYGDAKK